MHIKCWLYSRIVCNFITLEIIKLLLFDSDEEIAGYQVCYHTRVQHYPAAEEGLKEAVWAWVFCLLTYRWLVLGEKGTCSILKTSCRDFSQHCNWNLLLWDSLPQEKRVTLNSGLRSGIWICILMFPCAKSERIDQAKQLLLCYGSGESQAVYFAAGLWGEVIIILSRNMH